MPFTDLSNGALRAKILFALFAAASAAAAASAYAAQGTTSIIAVSGDLAPGDDRRFASFTFALPKVNEIGQVLFSGDLVGGDAFGNIYRWDNSTLSEIFRQGQNAFDGDGTFHNVVARSYNNVGQAVFDAVRRSETVGGQLLFRGDGATFVEIAHQSQELPDGSGEFAYFSSEAKLNDANQLAFHAGLTNTPGGATDNEGIFLGDGATLVQIAREGQAAPDGVGILYSINRNAHVNSAGLVAFDSGVIDSIGGTSSRGIFRGSTGTLEQIARIGYAVPGGNGTFLDFENYEIGEDGDVTFVADLDATSGGALDNRGIFRGNGATLYPIVREGQLAPDGDGHIGSLDREFALNETGQLAFVALLSNTIGGVSDNSAIYVGDDSSLTEITRKGQETPNGNGKFSFFGHPTLNNSGQIAFVAGIDSSSADINATHGIFLSSLDESQGLIEVARTGEPILGSTITSLNRFSIGGRGGFNYSTVGLSGGDSPRIAYQFGLADGRTGIALWTLVPEPSSLFISGVGAVLIWLVTCWPMRGYPQR